MAAGKKNEPIDAAPTQLGIDVLQQDDFRLLQGARVGLITNHTGRASDGTATIDLLHQAENVHLACLFGPEHGIRGELDTHVVDSVDERTNLPVYSLYGARQEPTDEQVAGLDTLVFDIQDIGCRFYTYSATLLRCLEVAARRRLRFVVCDRPNPITGQDPEGPLPDESRLSFTAPHPLPVRHGMTIGEMARLFAGERALDVELIVARCEHWRRHQWWDQTGLLWIDPSPNMRSLTGATLYPGVGLLEFTNISVGRGTGTPFEVCGAPFVHGPALAALLRQRGIPGIGCIPIEFTPTASKYAGERCGGIHLVVTDRERLQPVRLGLEIALALRELYVEEWEASKFLTLLASRPVMDGLLAGEDYPTLEKRWLRDLRAYKKAREPFLLYDE